MRSSAPSPSPACRGGRLADDSPDALVRRLLGEAARWGLPIWLTVIGHGAWNIAPNGCAIRGALLLEMTLEKPHASCLLDW